MGSTGQTVGQTKGKGIETMQEWTVTRQLQWPDGETVVEISSGGLDYTNPDALGAKYPGEFETFSDPREAVETAIAIADAWQADCPGEEILIGDGFTWGATMPFDGEELNGETRARLRQWAKETWEGLPRCDRCGDVLPKETFCIYSDPDLGTFCREYCAEETWAETFEESEEALA